MKLKDDLAQHRLAIMRLRVRGMNTKPSNYLQEEINTLRELSTAVVRQRDDLVRTLDKAEAHIKFLEDELCTVVADGHYSRARGEA